MNKTEEVVDDLLVGQTYEGVTLTNDIETAFVAYFDSNAVPAAEQNFTITDQISKYDFAIEATRAVYGETGNIPTLGFREKPYKVTCSAVEVMSLYSYLEVEEADSITFYFNEYMSMRIWDDEGNRIPMADNSIGLEMAAEFGDRADNGSGLVVSKCVYVLDAGTYYVRWIRAEATKSAAQFATDVESETNYFKFRVGIFPSSYEKDDETLEIHNKMLTPTVAKEMRSVAQCDTSLWEEDDLLTVSQLARSADKMNALLNGLDSISNSDFNEGIELSLDPDLPQGLFFLTIDNNDQKFDTLALKMYVDKGIFTFYKQVEKYASGGAKYNPITANVVGLTLREVYVSLDFKNVLYFDQITEGRYIVAVKYADDENDNIHLVIRDN